ncbi:hypothetical protein EHQ94_19810 [Leptospira meyeri]|uniref:hypothetical protein n=1 Tax=Leptospira meyeri TaxID=29508 RepID=UPI0010834E0A|nr:hypothetical protein [Leptospira meyeri]TGM60092.1 hypothetical protein EHQ93_18040 [Leptospira meyeri]TGM62932.1 hypothetical protein EHQ94_19810 [Leptospira meyeri]
MLDILGMSQNIKTKEDLIYSIDKYSKLILESQKTSYNPPTIKGSKEAALPNFEFFQFVFDTIVIVSREINPQNVSNFLLGLISLMETFFIADYPLRGSISKGSFIYEEDTNIFLSEIFKKLNNFEKIQEWTGCIILEDTIDIILENSLSKKKIWPNLKRANIIHLYDIPFKNNESKLLPCLNWSYMLSKSQVSKGMKYLENNLEKYYFTKKYLEYISSLEEDSSSLPKEFLPAVEMKTIKTRGNCRIVFKNEMGENCKPGSDNWSIFLK